jgi:hypothetical protein
MFFSEKGAGMADFSRKERDFLRELADKAHLREIEGFLEELSRKFDAWHTGGLKTGELHAAISEFYNDTSSRLLSLYGDAQPALLVGRALAVGLLKREEIPDELFSKLESAVRFYTRELDGVENKTPMPPPKGSEH